MALLLLSGATSLTACVGSDVVRVERLAVPAVSPYLLECPPEPEPPASVALQSEVAEWVLDVVEAGRECRTNLLAAKRILIDGAAP